MGRPRLYATNAERQKAYRASKNTDTVEVNAFYHEWLNSHLFALRDAVVHAAAAGDAVAATVDTVSPDDVILSLIKHFEGQAVALGPPAVAPMASAVVAPSAEVVPALPASRLQSYSVSPPLLSKGKKMQKNGRRG